MSSGLEKLGKRIGTDVGEGISKSFKKSTEEIDKKLKSDRKRRR